LGQPDGERKPGTARFGIQAAGGLLADSSLGLVSRFLGRVGGGGNCLLASFLHGTGSILGGRNGILGGVLGGIDSFLPASLVAATASLPASLVASAACLAASSAFWRLPWQHQRRLRGRSRCFFLLGTGGEANGNQGGKGRERVFIG
jgi:hypothetical protein